MKVFAVIALGLLTSLTVAQQSDVCLPPQATSYGYLSVSKMHITVIEDHDIGRILIAPADNAFSAPWMLVEHNENRIYRQEEGGECIYEEMTSDIQDMFNQCVAEDATLFGEIENSKIFMTMRPTVTRLLGLESIDNSTYYFRTGAVYQIDERLHDFAIVYSNTLGVLEPTALQKDLSQCVPLVLSVSDEIRAIFSNSTTD